MKKIELIISIIFLCFAVGFNLWIYRQELTAPVDPNDNTFQYALVYRTNQIWDFAAKKCSGNILTYPICHFSYLADHWVPNWNEGYNLPFYYSHIPQIIIVGAYRFLSLFSIHYSLFTFYHLVIYLLLCFFPLSIFLALLITGLSPLTAGFGALLATNISTDGLYGLDPSSFLWRGYGLSSQLFAMVWLPLALAYCYRLFNDLRFTIYDLRNLKSYFLQHVTDLFLAILFLILTTAGHLGLGIMAFLSLVPLALAAPVTAFLRRQPWREIVEPLKKNAVMLTGIAVIAIGALSYWILPAMTNDVYHNFSFWDPVWKFNSYGSTEIITRFFNGALFDFGRLPLFTTLILIGLFIAVGKRPEFSGFAYLFLFWFILYFGRTTWGNILNIIPGMKEFHLSRFIVGVHTAGMLLAPIGVVWIVEKLTNVILVLAPTAKQAIRMLLYGLALMCIIVPIYQQTIRYAAYNDTLITRAQQNYTVQSTDTNALIQTLQTLETSAPGRVFAGRGGSWGRDFRIGETPMYMYISNFAIPIVLWLPETWSPNADTEQYFRENFAEDYTLYNIRYVATPISLPKEQIQPFWKKITSGKSWILYSVNLSSLSDIGNISSGYFTVGTRPAVVAGDKYSRTNVIRLWIQSSDPKNGLYPQLSFDTKKYPMNVGLPNFKMLDEVTFITPDGKMHNLFSEPPKYISDVSNLGNLRITEQTDDTDMVFRATVTVPPNCSECVVILKQSYHPNWRVTVDGKPVTPIIVFPFYIGIPVTGGNHTIIASYEPSRLKIILLVLSLTTLTALIVWFLARKLGIDKKAMNIRD